MEDLSSSLFIRMEDEHRGPPDCRLTVEEQNPPQRRAHIDIHINVAAEKIQFFSKFVDKQQMGSVSLANVPSQLITLKTPVLDALIAVLRWSYSGKYETILEYKQISAWDVLYLAQRLSATELVKECQEHICDAWLTQDTVVHYYNAAASMSNVFIQARCGSIARENITAFLSHLSFPSLQAMPLKDLLPSIVPFQPKEVHSCILSLLNWAEQYLSSTGGQIHLALWPELSRTVSILLQTMDSNSSSELSLSSFQDDSSFPSTSSSPDAALQDLLQRANSMHLLTGKALAINEESISQSVYSYHLRQEHEQQQQIQQQIQQHEQHSDSSGSDKGSPSISDDFNNALSLGYQFGRSNGDVNMDEQPSASNNMQGRKQHSNSSGRGISASHGKRKHHKPSMSSLLHDDHSNSGVSDFLNSSHSHIQHNHRHGISDSSVFSEDEEDQDQDHDDPDAFLVPSVAPSPSVLYQPLAASNPHSHSMVSSSSSSSSSTYYPLLQPSSQHQLMPSNLNNSNSNQRPVSPLFHAKDAQYYSFPPPPLPATPSGSSSPPFSFSSPSYSSASSPPTSSFFSASPVMSPIKPSSSGAESAKPAAPVRRKSISGPSGSSSKPSSRRNSIVSIDSNPAVCTVSQFANLASAAATALKSARDSPSPVLSPDKQLPYIVAPSPIIAPSGGKGRAKKPKSTVWHISGPHLAEERQTIQHAAVDVPADPVIEPPSSSSPLTARNLLSAAASAASAAQDSLQLSAASAIINRRKGGSSSAGGSRRSSLSTVCSSDNLTALMEDPSAHGFQVFTPSPQASLRECVSPYHPHSVSPTLLSLRDGQGHGSGSNGNSHSAVAETSSDLICFKEPMSASSTPASTPTSASSMYSYDGLLVPSGSSSSKSDMGSLRDSNMALQVQQMKQDIQQLQHAHLYNAMQQMRQQYHSMASPRLHPSSMLHASPRLVMSVPNTVSSAPMSASSLMDSESGSPHISFTSPHHHPPPQKLQQQQHNPEFSRRHSAPEFIASYQAGAMQSPHMHPQQYPHPHMMMFHPLHHNPYAQHQFYPHPAVAYMHHHQQQQQQQPHQQQQQQYGQQSIHRPHHPMLSHILIPSVSSPSPPLPSMSASSASSSSSSSSSSSFLPSPSPSPSSDGSNGSGFSGRSSFAASSSQPTTPSNDDQMAAAASSQFRKRNHSSISSSSSASLSSQSSASSMASGENLSRSSSGSSVDIQAQLNDISVQSQNSSSYSTPVVSSAPLQPAKQQPQQQQHQQQQQQQSSMVHMAPLYASSLASLDLTSVQLQQLMRMSVPVYMPSSNNNNNGNNSGSSSSSVSYPSSSSSLSSIEALPPSSSSSSSASS